MLRGDASSRAQIRRRLSVVVRMQIDPARSDQQAVGIDVTLGGALFAADCGNATVRDGDVAAERGLARPIDDGAAANDDVVHANLPGNGRIGLRWATQGYPFGPASGKGLRPSPPRQKRKTALRRSFEVCGSSFGGSSLQLFCLPLAPAKEAQHATATGKHGEGGRQRRFAADDLKIWVEPDVMVLENTVQPGLK